MKETVEQKMQFIAKRMQRYEKRGKFYCQNLLFKNDSKKFYRDIENEKLTVNETTAINYIEQFSGTICSE